MTKEEILQKDKFTKEEFRLLLNDIHKMSCLEFVKKLPDRSIDIVVTSPPYNMGNVDRSENPKRPKVDYDKDKSLNRDNNPLFGEGYADFDDCLPHSEYIKQQRTLLKELTRALTDEGAIFYNTKWRNYGGEVEMLHDILAGFCVRQVIIWSAFTSLCWNDRMFAPRYEVIYFITKTNIAKGNNTKLTKEGTNYGDIWTFARETNNSHPAPFPIDLPYYAIKSIDNHGRKMVVYDPYMGSGTTAVAAACCGYDYLGTDLTDSYIEMAKKRLKLNEIQPESKNLFNNKTAQAKKFKEFNDNATAVKVNKLSL